METQVVSIYMSPKLRKNIMARKPNIILILADDMGYGDAGCYGGKHLQTPAIDTLADRGLRFTDFHSNAPVCSPTRAALLTGCYQQRCGIEGVISAKNHREKGLSLENVTFADLLKTAGYRTAVFGKWHLGYEPRFNPRYQGFDEFVGFVSGNIDYHSHIDQAGVEDWWQDVELIPEEGYSTDLVTSHGLSFIQRHKDKPFCLYLAHECPHYPYQGPNDPADRTVGKPEPILGRRKDRTAAYKEMMESMDTSIDRIVRKINSLDLEKETFIFFCSDNGPTGPGSSGPLKGKKGSLWEGGHRVPGIAYWPSKIRPGTVTNETALTMDLLPTLASLAGLSPPTTLKLDGVDLLPLMVGEKPLSERSLFWRFKNDCAIRKGPWKLINGESQSLFHLDDDISETTNIIRKEQERGKSLEQELMNWSRKISVGIERQS
jgi:arylsulfatase A-like enzyme